ncbi:MAG: hypothetical protein ACFE0Q_14360 [Anaerolineae bacterium]
MNKIAQITTMLFFILIFTKVSYAQDTNLTGPVIGTAWNGSLLIYDIGAEQTWEIENLSLRAGDLQWSNDGCNLLAQQATNNWIVWSFQDEQIRTLPDSEQFLAPFWSPNSSNLTYTEHDRENDQSIIWNLSLSDLQPETIVAIDGLGFALDWLNSDEILYEYDGLFQTINVADNSVENFGSSLYPRYPRSAPSGYLGTLSPDQYSLAIYALSGYGLSTSENEDAESDNSENVETGLTIIDLNDGTETTYHMNNQFVIGMRWAPSSSRIVVVSVTSEWEKEDFIVSILNLDSGELIPVENFNLNYYPDLGGYVPSWSSDETYLAIQTNDGPIMYNLETRTSMILPNVLEGTLHWSPIQNYDSDSQCN